ncbi:hypothetical protein MYCTH_2057132 [Thermothelomyces thermophilus ATCC 42464]|uniref:Zn(2)-C6 fungal-type domain-containing protein n=1 Tax=Thermothelomyces thermophilus (strain ATCC 42464 / BCRC 31852 / DSM 1799) TaxID=573729 RepID=G2Q9Z0_THET4|nr:uncharacterized protein MYCTH_2057132 [Thermothelomyces thermophilus ATCC 42464]AEO56594.1 hypothetical protein MYCTH_2057132 [Thermothelomyces thermophilus ATCC 42464]
MAPPPAYRTIQPAPVKGPRTGALSSGPTGPQWLGSKGLTKRLKAVTQACHTCRRNKAKVCRESHCDGVRPKCGSCSARNSPCGYDGEAGQSRRAALRARLEELEKLFGDLVTPDYTEAKRLLDRIRASAHDLTPLLTTWRESEDRSARQAAATTTMTSAPPSDASESSFPGRSPNSSSDGSTSPAASGSSSSSTNSGNSSGTQGTDDDSASLLLHLDVPLPGAKTTRAGVQTFFGSTGKLFHVYTQRQMEAYHTAVFGADDGKPPDTSRGLELCCLYAVAAVGVLYNAGTFQPGLENVFHDVSRRFFSDLMEQRPLDTIKVCTLYAMYNVLDKATVALAYVEVGLGMSKRQSQNTGVCHPSKVSSEEWIDFRRTWRALVFLSKQVPPPPSLFLFSLRRNLLLPVLTICAPSWLSSTLGYISGADDGEFTRLLPVAGEDEDSYSAELGELVQAEMTKIVLLKAGILRNHLAVPELTALGMDGIIRELQEWHEQLPEPMKLRSLYYYRADWPPPVRWSIYHLHLLYHGAFMLVYRRIAAHCVRLRRTGRDLASSAAREPNLVSLVEQGVTSARDTARIVSLLLGEQGVFRRCWIVIFQAHTACVVILYSVAQRKLHGFPFPPSPWAEDMERARQCIDVLGYCGDIDPVALRFRVRLSGIYDSLLSAANAANAAGAPQPTDVDDGQQQQKQQQRPEPHPIGYLFTAPPTTPPSDLSDLSLTLLFALCRPWSDPGGLNTVGPNGPMDVVAAAAGGGGDQRTKQQMTLDKLEWDFEKITPFRWDTGSMGPMLCGADEVVGTSCFLDSEAPSGWKRAEDIEADG